MAGLYSLNMVGPFARRLQPDQQSLADRPGVNRRTGGRENEVVGERRLLAQVKDEDVLAQLLLHQRHNPLNKLLSFHFSREESRSESRAGSRRRLSTARPDSVRSQSLP